MKDLNTIYECESCSYKGNIDRKCEECIRCLDPDDPPSNWRSDDMVNHPAHYASKSGLEVIDVIEAFTSELKGIEAVCTANVIKYVCRWYKKNGVQDLEKAKWYLQHLIDHLDKTEMKAK